MSSNEQLNSIREYDRETGSETDESRAANHSEAIRQVIDIATSLEEMKLTKGWAYIESAIYDCIENKKDSLVDAKELEEIRRLQQSIAAYSNILGLVETSIQDGIAAREEVSRLQTPGFQG